MGIVGTGTIGASLLDMLVEQREVLRTQFHLDLQIRAVANADKVCGTPFLVFFGGGREGGLQQLVPSGCVLFFFLCIVYDTFCCFFVHKYFCRVYTWCCFFHVLSHFPFSYRL